MKSAVVFGARQPLGYELCVQLLEKGYKVYAKDFAEWQNEDHEEKWLYIGRNANLQYEHLNHIFEEKHDSIQYFFIPLADFYKRDFPEIQERFTQLLKEYGKENVFSNSNIVLIQSSAIHFRNSNFYSEIERFKKEIQENITNVIEYCIPINEQDKFLLSTTNQREDWCTLKISLSSNSIVNEIIEHIETTAY
ncbi:hypothetical protein ACFFF5_05350 [Lederbergia wuyishanensis]|uniref:Uncharacterized protein n=1 Tax=Lederbergia wuyishanensis TaxID=1347903 RepID=A0ABU0CYZ3_9BACI|nr:hypothetical protein [Lederbergia wuyishanensis]MCJ8005992.1 hypothetical protein [Lederbergia wuyishanensis]MDQ0341358.1 hypothetical protein [Lederbergia wuyishanensis]